MRRHDLPWPNARLLEQSGEDAGALEAWQQWFAPAELDVAAAFAREQRRMQWLLSRTAAKQLAVERGLCEEASRCRVDRTRIRTADGAELAFSSLSHSGLWAAAAIDEEPVGIDVQVVRNLSERAAHLFLSDAEETSMRSCGIPNRLLHFWCAKEAAWKARAGETVTLRSVPLELRSEGPRGLRFDTAETWAEGELVLAITRPSL